MASSRSRLAKMRAAQRQRIKDATIYNPNYVLHGASLRHALGDIIKGQTAPLQRQSAGLGRLGEQTAGNIESGFRSLAEGMASRISRSNAMTAGATGGLRQSGAALQGQLAQVGAGAQADITKSLLPGQEVSADARAALAARLASRQADAALQSEARAGAAQQSGDARTALLEAMSGSSALQGATLAAGARSAVASRRADLAGQIADIQGPGRTKALHDLITGERTYMGEQAALGIQAQGQQLKALTEKHNYRTKIDALKEDRRHNRITEQNAADQIKVGLKNANTRAERVAWQNQADKLKNRKLRTDLKYFAKHGHYPSGSRGGGSGGSTGGPTRVQKHDNFVKFHQALQNAGDGMRAGDPGAINDPILLGIAYRYTHGKLTKADRRTLRKQYPGSLAKP